MVKSTKKTEERQEEYELVGEISKYNDEKKIVFGWAYVSHDKDGQQMIDKSGEFFEDPDVLEEAAYDFVLNSRMGKDYHDLMKADSSGAQLPAATLIESVFMSKEKQEAMGIPEGFLPQSAWWVGFKVHDDSLWDDFKNGNRPMFSVHGSGTKRLVTQS